MLTKLYVSAQNRLASDEGATAVEYGVMVALIAVAIIVAVTAVGGQLSTLFQRVTVALGGAAPAAQ